MHAYHLISEKSGKYSPDDSRIEFEENTREYHSILSIEGVNRSKRGE